MREAAIYLIVGLSLALGFSYFVLASTEKRKEALTENAIWWGDWRMPIQNVRYDVVPLKPTEVADYLNYIGWEWDLRATYTIEDKVYVVIERNVGQ